MKQSMMYIPTLKQIPSDAKIVSHQFLMQGGYIKQEAAGIYNYLPLGYRVLKKIEQVIREEITNANGQEILMPVLQPAEFWQETMRLDAYGPELMRLNDRHDREFILGPTHEEVITDIIRDYVKSYKKLPFTLFQIQTKFRDELRPRFGLMRGREFLMMDAYSFSATEEDLAIAYEDMAGAYRKVLERLELKYRQVSALSGEIGGSESAEFMVLTEVGEDTILYSDDTDFVANQEVYPDLGEGMATPDGKGTIKIAKGIEIGHIFKLGTKYSEAMKAYITTKEGTQAPIIMGCYGIGVSRLIMAVIEQQYQQGHFVWPLSITPFFVHILLANSKDAFQRQTAEKIYEQLRQLGIEVLYDDRDERLGVKFADADFIAVPYHVVVGKDVKEGYVEFRDRIKQETEKYSVEDIVSIISRLMK